MRGGRTSFRVTPSYDAGHNQTNYMYHTTDLIALVRVDHRGTDVDFEADALQAAVNALRAN